MLHLTGIILVLVALVVVTSLIISEGRAIAQPVILDENLKVEKVTDELRYPTSLDFLGPDDILVLEKDNGTVRRIVNGNLIPEPLLDVNVLQGDGRGMFGIAILEKETNTYVYISYSASNDGVDTYDENRSGSNVLYRYELVNDSKLTNPLLIRNISARPDTLHYGGTLVVGPDKNIYHVVGDHGFIDQTTGDQTRAQNIREGEDPNGTSGISLFSYNGSAASPGILGDKAPLDQYYAYGIRNSFGLAFDPITGYLWDTENGPDHGDEINLVLPGFNSGWGVVQGVPAMNGKNAYGFDAALSVYEGNNHDKYFPLDFMETFEGKGRYMDPAFEWRIPVGVTAIAFLNSSKIGDDYKGNMFVGDINGGRVYSFELMPDRMSLSLHGSLEDRIANSHDELNEIIFAKDFGGITDIKEGPDGYLYVVSHLEGSIYRIVPK